MHGTTRRVNGVELIHRKINGASVVIYEWLMRCRRRVDALHYASLCARVETRTELTTVTLKPNEPVEVALRRFRRSIENTGLIKELRARMSYETPTAERKRKKAAAVARLRKQIRRSLPPKKMY